VTIYLNKDIYSINNLIRIVYSLAKGTINIISIIVKYITPKELDLYNTLENTNNLIIKKVIIVLYSTNNYL